MDISVYQAAAGMNASARWQEVIAENLAASQIPGFKKQEMSFSAVQSGFSTRPGNAATGPAQRFAMPLAASSTNFQAGELHRTDGPTDFAIEGTGFFEVQMPDGTKGYTRDGEFRMSSQGQLLTKQGLKVMGETGPLQFDANAPGPITLAPSGEVSQGGMVRGRIKVVDFNDPSLLTPTGTGYFVATDPNAQPRAASAATVHQGFLENSNTSSVFEMTNLIAAMRLYEANQKVAQMEDTRVGQLISDVSNAS
jgi:flagellar basal-body rod protein FlgF